MDIRLEGGSDLGEEITVGTKLYVAPQGPGLPQEARRPDPVTVPSALPEAPELDFTRALEKRLVSSTSGGRLVPTMHRNGGDWGSPGSHRDAIGPDDLLSPTHTEAESSALSYGSSMKDEERRAKLKAKMDKVGALGSAVWGLRFRI
jgi:hypothetical protein